MNPQILLNRPKIESNLTPKITKLGNFSNVVESSLEIKKSSTKLKKIFEKGTYQKKTQLVVLNRYKRRLDSIQKQNDKRFSERKKVKIKPPEIKKYTGSLFTAGTAGDPLKMMAGLAALNSFTRLKNGNWIDAIGPGLVAAGLFFGPSVLKSGMNLRRGGGQQPQVSAPSGGRMFWGTPYAETKAGKAYAGMQAQRNLPKWAQRMAGGSASRFAASNEKIIQGTANIGDKARVASRRFGFSGAGGIAEKFASRGSASAATGVAGSVSTRTGGSIAAKAAGIGGRAIPLLGAALNIGLSAYRFSEGDVVGGILSAVSAIPVIGWAALGVDLAREFGAFDGTIFGRKGKEKLKKETEKQKQLVESKKQSVQVLTFRKTLFGYEKVINKFEQFAMNFKPTGTSLTEEVSPTEYSEPDEYPDDTGDYGPMTGALSSDILEFRKFRNEKFGASKERFATASPRLYQIRELGIWEGGKRDNWKINPLADDTAYEKNEHAGAGHWENRAFDIPVPNSSREGDMVAEFWRKRGYKVIWKSDGHYDHVHVEVPQNRAKDFFSGKPNQPPQAKPPTPPSTSVQPVSGSKYTLRGTTIFKGTDGKYYSTEKGNDGKFLEVDKRNWEFVKKEGELVSFSSRERNIEAYPSYNDPSGTIAMIYMPQQQIQPQVIQQERPPSMSFTGPSEEQVLNRYYKDILLTRLA
jgi:hypothetical protein